MPTELLKPECWVGHWERKLHYFTLFSLCFCHMTFLFFSLIIAFLWSCPNFPVFSRCCVGLKFRDSYTARQLRCLFLASSCSPRFGGLQIKWTLTKSHMLPYDLPCHLCLIAGSRDAQFPRGTETTVGNAVVMSWSSDVC